jgi:nucleotidyltransferase substrate binding protein (TIGR01987 family)
MALDLTPLRNALRALDKSVAFLNSDLANNPELREQFRSAAIQAFEFTYELAYKMLKRQLEEELPSQAGLRGETFMFLIRTGAEAGLIRNVARFRAYRDTRNITSHTYDPRKAEEVVSVLPEFLEDCHYLLDRLTERNEH